MPAFQPARMILNKLGVESIILDHLEDPTRQLDNRRTGKIVPHLLDPGHRDRHMVPRFVLEAVSYIICS
jgi:hypothetical protein